jgi:hypothetical protein
MTVPIYFLIPTRKRPDKLRASIESFKSLAKHPDRCVPLLFADDDDPTDYRACEYVVRGPRWGYAGLHGYFNELSRWARRLHDGHHFQIIWNDDERMTVQDWDEKLVAYGDSPKVVFMRRDCYERDTAYPALPRSFIDLVQTVGTSSALDTWLAELTKAVDALLGREATHIHAFDIPVHHQHEIADRLAEGHFEATLPETYEGIGWDAAVLALARAHGFTG